tara:strand:+ start:956 stop:1222 length:267 start_codon:yes stop_codon:yes gene_type:complete
MNNNKRIKYAKYDEDGNILHLEEIMKTFSLLSPYMYPDDNKKISINMLDGDGNPTDYSPLTFPIKGWIGLVGAILHQLEHEEKVKFDN